MNILNLGSKESITSITLSQDGFKSDCPGKIKNESTLKSFYFFHPPTSEVLNQEKKYLK